MRNYGACWRSAKLSNERPVCCLTCATTSGSRSRRTSAGLRLPRELATQSKLLGYVNTQIYDPLAEIRLSKHDELEQLKASLGLGSMLPSSAGEFLCQSVMGELNAGRLYRDKIF